jgi:hypothetical protein
MACYVLYDVAGGHSSRTCVTKMGALGIARALLASGKDVRQLGSLDGGGEDETMNGDELRRLFSSAP